MLPVSHVSRWPVLGDSVFLQGLCEGVQPVLLSVCSSWLRILVTQVRVVGVTCAACLFPCLSGLQFPVVLLDEGSQMTEPASLLPIAR